MIMVSHLPDKYIGRMIAAMGASLAIQFKMPSKVVIVTMSIIIPPDAG